MKYLLTIYTDESGLADVRPTGRAHDGRLRRFGAEAGRPAC